MHIYYIVSPHNKHIDVNYLNIAVYIFPDSRIAAIQAAFPCYFSIIRSMLCFYIPTHNLNNIDVAI